MSDMRAKMLVADVDRSNEGVEYLEFRAVGRNDSYPEDGSDENNTYAKWTPNGSVHLTVTNPNLHGKFVIGDTYYLDFTKVEETKEVKENTDKSKDPEVG